MKKILSLLLLTTLLISTYQVIGQVLITPDGSIKEVVGAAHTAPEWKFYADAGDRINFGACGSEEFLYMYLTTEAGSYVAFAMDGCSKGWGPYLDWTCPASGFYIISLMDPDYDYGKIFFITTLTYQRTYSAGFPNSISGNAGVAGATLSFTAGTPKTATSDLNGDYTLGVSNNWNGSVTVTKTGFLITPASKTYTNVTTNIPAQNYSATTINYTISGNAGIAGATMSYTDGITKTATADDTGNYSLVVSYNWNGTVTPTKTGYSFSASKTYTNVLADKTGENYTATAIAPEIDIKQNVTLITDESGSFDLGSINFGSGVDIVFTIENSGSAASTLGSFSLTNTADFSLVGVTPSTVANGSSVTFTVRFMPVSEGLKSSSISFSNQDSNENPYNFTLTGTGVVTAPSAPTATAATSISGNGFTANWNTVAGSTSYSLEVSTDNFATLVGGNSYTINAPVVTKAITGLTAGCDYKYRVKAVNTNGSSAYSNIISVTTTQAIPKITSLSPAFGPVGSQMTINGVGFSAIPGNNIVYFGAVKATVISSSLTSITVIVPVGPGSIETVSVVVRGLVAFSTTSTTPVFDITQQPSAVPAYAINPLPGLANIMSTATGDFNGDGKPDVAICNGVAAGGLWAGILYINLGNGAGSFTTKSTVSLPQAALSMVTGDFNGDGKVDIATANSGIITILIGDGTGNFSATTIPADSWGAHFIVKGDFNGDGNTDLAYASYAGSGYIGVMMGNGTGAFGTPIMSTRVYGLYSICAADINSDGKTELVGTNLTTNQMHILQYNGASGFNLTNTYATGDLPRYLTVGDFNKDGKPDVVVLNDRASSMSVFLNTGSGNLGSGIVYPLEGAPFQATVGDFNGDGNPDIVIPYLSSGVNAGITVLLGNGAGTFPNKYNFSAGAGAAEITSDVADFNMDGKSDIVATYNTGNIFMSHTPIPLATTLDVTNVTTNGATGNGNVTDLGTSAVTQYGVVWGKTRNPSADLSTRTKLGTKAATGAFASPITGLEPNTTYYIRAYATNSAGSGYGEETSFTTMTPTIASATYDATTGTFVVTGSGLSPKSGANNDIDVTKLIVTGQGGATYTLTSANVELTSSTQFTVVLNATDKTAVNLLLNKNGSNSTGGTAYNLAAAEDWAASADPSTVIADLTGNGITVSNVPGPTISSVSVPNDGTYKAGEALDFTVNFIEPVTVVTTGGTPTLRIVLNTGGTVNVTYLSGSGTTALVFRYTIIAGNQDADGISVGASINTYGGTIRSSGGLDANLMLNNVGSTANVKVDAILPTVTSIVRLTPSGSVTNETTVTYTITFSENVGGVDASDFSLTRTGTVSGTIATVSAATGTSMNVRVSSITGDGTLQLNLNNSGTGIKDNATNPILGGFATGETYTFDHTVPVVSSVGVPVNATYKAGQNLDFTVNFGEATTVVTTDGSPYISVTLNTGGTVNAYYLSGSGTSALTFRYTVVSGNNDNDGVVLGSSIVLNGGTLKDASGNNAFLTLSAIGGTTGIKVDALAPTSAITIADNALKAGETTLVTFTFSEAVTGFTNANLTIANGNMTAVGSADGGITWTATFTPTNNIEASTNIIRLSNTTITDAVGNVGSGTTNSGNYSIDTKRPTAAIALNDNALKADETALVTITFSEAVMGFTKADLTVANGVLSGLSSVDGGVTWTMIFTPTPSLEDATNLITIDNTGYTDAAGNTGIGITDSPNYVIETKRPTVAITLSDTAMKIGETSVVTFTFSEAVTGFTNADLTIANGILTSVSTVDGGITWTATFTPSASLEDATNVITFNNAGVSDGTGNTGSGITDSPNYTIDTKRPALASAISISDNALRIGDNATITITFTEAITGFTTSDLTSPNGNLTSLSTANGGITWTATLTPIANIENASNILTLDITGILDLAGNVGSGSANSGNYSVDTKRPALANAITISDQALKVGETAVVTFVFTEAVTGFTNAELTIANGTMTAVNSSNGGITWTSTFTPTANLEDASNLITLDNTGYSDVAGNIGTGTSNSPNYSIDTKRPTATISLDNSALKVGETTIVSIVFSEPVTGFTNADLTIANGNLTAVSSSDGGITWIATFTPTANLEDATNVIVLANSGITDLSGNIGTGTSSSDNYTIDTKRPTVGITLNDNALKIGENATVTFTFSEAVTGFSNDDLTIANGILTSVGSTDGGITYTATFTPTASVEDATNVITIDNSAYADLAGNAGSGSTDSPNYSIDTKRPTISITAALTAGGNAIVNQGEMISGFLVVAQSSENTGNLYVVPSTTPGTLVAIMAASIGNAASAGANTNTTISISGNNAALANGLEYSVYSTDGAGNVSTISEVAFLSAIYAPSAPVITSPSSGTITNNNKPSISGTTVPFAKVYVLFDALFGGIATADGSGAWTYTPVNSIVDGPHLVSANSTDAAGNASVFSGTKNYTIDTSKPTVQSVETPALATYLSGQYLDFTVNFSEMVTVVKTGGTPFLTLTIGGINVHAEYLSGSGTTALVFRYVIVSGDLDTDGISVGGAIISNGGTIKDAADNDVILALNNVGSTSGIKVDALLSPATQATALLFSNVQSNRMTIGWTNGTGSKRVVFVKSSNTGTTTPVNNVSYIADPVFTNGTQINSGWYCVYNGTGSSVNVTGLTIGTNYIAQVFEYNGPAGSEKYMTTSASNNPKIQATLSCANPTNGGTIATDQAGCISIDVAEITSTQPATDFTGTLEYKWQYSMTNSSSGFMDIDNSNSLTYSPGTITTTTWYRRLARVTCLSNWTGATSSNVIKMTVYPVSVGGHIAGGTSQITYGEVTGTMTLGGQTGTVVKWQKKVESEPWSDISNTSSTFSEKPASVGTWYYRALVKSGDCSEAFSDPISIVVSRKTLTITADDKSKVYNGSTYGTFTVTYNGFIAGENVADLGGALSFSGSATTAVNFGTNYVITPNGLTSNNYDISFVSGKLDITKKNLTITSSGPSKEYGTSLATVTSSTNFTASATGIGTEVVTSVKLTPDAAGISGSTQAGAAYVVTPSQATGTGGFLESNYAITYESYNGTVSKKTLVVTANNKSKPYGDPIRSLTVSYNGLVNGDRAPATLPAISTTATSTSQVGTYPISATGAADPNYTISYQPGVFTVEKAAMMIFAENKFKNYGAPLPLLTASYSGLVNGDTAPATLPAISTTATLSSPVATYPISATGAADPNYTINYSSGVLTVGKAELLISADNKSKGYGAAIPTLTVHYTGLLNGDTAPATLPVIGTTATASSPVSTYPISATGAMDPNYTISYQPGNLSVEKVGLIITADNKTKTYGATLPTLKAVYSGLVNGDIAPSTLPAISTTATASSLVGSYPISTTGAADPNYTISYLQGVLTIEKADLIIAADNKSKSYGAALPTLTASYMGLVNGDIAPATLPAISTTATASSPVATYPITATGAADPNYTITYSSGSLTVGKAGLLISADNKSKNYGASLPLLTASYIGLVNGDTAPATLPTISTTATVSSPVAVYPITANGAMDPNYTISYSSGTMTVEKVALMVTANNQSKSYGAALPTLTVGYIGLVNGDTAPASLPSISTTALASSAVGTYPISATGAADPNYAISYTSGELKVEKVSLMITSDNKSKNYGDALPTLTVSYSGLVNGDTTPSTLPLISTTATATSPVNTYPITASGASDPNYTISYGAGILIVGKRSLNISADVKSKVYGETDPEFTYAYAPALIGTDVFTGTLSRLAGENVGSYAIGLGTLNAGSNYTMTFVGKDLNIGAKALAISNPVVTTSKTYDALTSAKVVQGNLIGVVAGDENKLSVSATANYANKNIGANKTITVAYQISGDASGNYTKPVDYTSTNGVIVAKQLTIANTSITTNKMADGNTSAVVLNVGTLTGVEAVDASNITISVIANYDDAKIGLTKTITVVYTLGGTAASNYIVPANLLITNAKISEKVVLQTLTKPTAGCSGSDLILNYTVLNGTPTQYQIVFGQTALSAGFQNISYLNLSSSGTNGIITIPVPSGIPNGTYTGTLQVRNELAMTSDLYPFQFVVNVSADYIIAKFDDVVLIDNKAGKFSAYQWYKNGVAIAGATKQYYNDPAGLVGTYSLKLVSKTGEEIMTCPKVLNIPKKTKVGVSVYPNPMKAYQHSTVRISGLTIEDLQGAVMTVYNMAGVPVYTTAKVEELTPLTIQNADGIYVVHVITKSGDDLVYRILLVK